MFLDIFSKKGVGLGLCDVLRDRVINALWKIEAILDFAFQPVFQPEVQTIMYDFFLMELFVYHFSPNRPRTYENTGGMCLVWVKSTKK